MTGHKKRFCSFKSWMRITNIIKNTGYVRSVARENTHPDVSVVKSALRRMLRANRDRETRRTQSGEKLDYQV